MKKKLLCLQVNRLIKTSFEITFGVNLLLNVSASAFFKGYFRLRST